MRDVVLRSAENTQQTAENCAENSGHFKYDEIMRRISALGWSTDLRQFPELNFIHDYYVQIEGQLYCSNLDLKGIVLIVYFGESRPLFVEKIFVHNSWTSDSAKDRFLLQTCSFP